MALGSFAVLKLFSKFSEPTTLSLRSNGQPPGTPDDDRVLIWEILTNFGEATLTYNETSLNFRSQRFYLHRSVKILSLNTLSRMYIFTLSTCQSLAEVNGHNRLYHLSFQFRSSPPCRPHARAVVPNCGGFLCGC